MKPWALLLVLAFLGGCTPREPAPMAVATAGPPGQERTCPYDPPRTDLGGRDFTLPDSAIEDILAAIGEAHAPQLAPGGLMSGAHVCGGHVIEDGNLEVRFDHGIDLHYYPAEVSTEAEFIRELREEFRDPEAPLPGWFVAFRGTTAGVLEAGPDGPAFVGWLEGSFEMELFGRGRQPLNELLALGRTLVAAG